MIIFPLFIDQGDDTSDYYDNIFYPVPPKGYTYWSVAYEGILGTTVFIVKK